MATKKSIKDTRPLTKKEAQAFLDLWIRREEKRGKSPKIHDTLLMSKRHSRRLKRSSETSGLITTGAE